MDEYLPRECLGQPHNHPRKDSDGHDGDEQKDHVPVSAKHD